MANKIEKTQTPKANPMQSLRDALNAQFMERNEIIDGMLVALISGEPLILIGPPGTAKSAICNKIAESISGSFFSWMMTKFTVPEELFGPLSLKALEQDKYQRVTDGKLPKCHVAFIDEVGKASSSISNTLLTALNEKTFHNGGKAEALPLKVLYGASNEVPDSSTLSAFYDRFVLRYYVDYIGSDDNMKVLLAGAAPVSMPKLSLTDVDSLRAASESLPMSSDLIDILIQIRREVAADGIMVSDRKWMQAVKVIKACAILNGHAQVEIDDMEILSAMLWSTPDQIAKVRKIVGKLTNPAGEKIMSITDGIRDMVRDLNKKKPDGKDDGAIEAFSKIKHAITALEKLRSDKPNAKLDQALQWAKTQHRDIAQNHLKLSI